MSRNVYEGSKKYIFISYSHKDQAVVERMLDIFDKHNIRYWYDAGIEAGSEYSDIIAQHIKDCYCMLSVISEHSISSKYCRRERLYGIEQLDKLPLTIYAEDVRLSSGEEMLLHSFQTIRYFEFDRFEDFEYRVVCSPLVRECKKDDGELTADEFFRMAVNYYNGVNHTEQDYQKAVENFRSASEKGHAEATYFLGQCYYLGNGVEQSYEQAAAYYKAAAEKGFLAAADAIGMCYKYGDGVPVDNVQAFTWFSFAATKGYPEAQTNLGLCYEKGIGTNVDAAEAVRWYTAAARLGNARAQYNLGNCLKHGLGVERDSVAAFRWFRRSAVQGYAQAQTLLGNSYKDGDGVEQNIPEAIRWFKKAADQRIARALLALGAFYESGAEGISIDLREAEHWYKEAVESGLSAAKERLEGVRARIAAEQ